MEIVLGDVNYGFTYILKYLRLLRLGRDMVIAEFWIWIRYNEEQKKKVFIGTKKGIIKEGRFINERQQVKLHSPTVV